MLFKEYNKVIREYYDKIKPNKYYRKEYLFHKHLTDSFISIDITQIGYDYKCITILTQDVDVEIFNRLVKYFIGNIDNKAYDENKNYGYISQSIFTH